MAERMSYVPEPSLPIEQRRHASDAASGIADYLLERRDVLDRALRKQDRSAMSSIMRRSPPAPSALVAIGSLAVRARFLKLLENANVGADVTETSSALTLLEQRTHAVMFTDDVNLIRQARGLHAGAVTHVVFVDHAGEGACEDAWRAGANACMPQTPGGAEFWAQLTTARRIVSLAASLQLALSDNRVLSTIDELTGCGSRRFFEQEFPREVERALRLGRPLALIMCDIDHFKSVNDKHGHQTGDQILSGFGEVLRDGLRLGQDWVARVGGEEFAVVLPDTAVPEGLGIAERLRERVRTKPFGNGARMLRITASFGVSGFLLANANALDNTGSLIARADGALYESKRRGRDRVSASSELATELSKG